MNVVFHEDNEDVSLNSRRRARPRGGMTAWLVRKGFFADEKRAATVLAVVAAALLLLAFIVTLFFGRSRPPVPKDPSYQIDTDEQYLFDAAAWERDRARGIIR